MARPKPVEPKIALTISVPVSLKKAFMEACAKDDKQASQILREAMRSYIEHRSK